MNCRLIARAWCVVVASALVALTGCGGGPSEQTANEEAGTGKSPVANRGSDGGLGFVPATYRAGDRVVLPVTFPDGTTAELVYPPELVIAELGVFPYLSGSLHGKSPTPGRSDTVARDFWIRYGELGSILALRNGGSRPDLLDEYEGADGQVVGFWDGSARTALGVHHLGFQFGRWAVLVYDYVGGGAQMTDAERASWAANFFGHETTEGFLQLERAGPLRLARVGEHAGPMLTFAAGEPTRELILTPGECHPHRDQTMLVDGRLVSWNGGLPTGASPTRCASTPAEAGSSSEPSSEISR